MPRRPTSLRTPPRRASPISIPRVRRTRRTYAAVRTRRSRRGKRTGAPCIRKSLSRLGSFNASDSRTDIACSRATESRCRGRPTRLRLLTGAAVNDPLSRPTHGITAKGQIWVGSVQVRENRRRGGGRSHSSQSGRPLPLLGEGRVLYPMASVATRTGPAPRRTRWAGTNPANATAAQSTSAAAGASSPKPLTQCPNGAPWPTARRSATEAPRLAPGPVTSWRVFRARLSGSHTASDRWALALPRSSPPASRVFSGAPPVPTPAG